MKRTFFPLLPVLLAVLLLSACGGQVSSPAPGQYVSISQEEAKSLIDSESDYVILDVRTREEFAQVHIPGALLIPHTEIADRAEQELPDKAQLILVYCRSGNRSKTASQALADMGYTNVKEFGGVNTWPYETE